MIIAFTGKKRSGKDTAVNYILRNHEGYQRYAFADPIKEMCKIAFDWRDIELNGDQKETIDPFYGISPRQALQFIGTDLFQKELPRLAPNFSEVTDRGIWVRRFIKTFWSYSDSVRPTFLISDMRFPHEAEVIRELLPEENLYIIQINRPGYEGDSHLSETEMESISPDFVIENDTGIYHLESKVKNVLGKIIFKEFAI